MCMNTSPNVLETLRLLRFIGIDIFFNQITLYHGVTQNAVFSKRKTSWNSKLEKRFIPVGHLQPPKDKNSKPLRFSF